MATRGGRGNREISYKRGESIETTTTHGALYDSVNYFGVSQESLHLY